MSQGPVGAARRARRKQVEEAGRDGGHRAVASLRTDDGTVHLTFDEAVPRETEVAVPLDDLLRGERTVPLEAAAGEDTEPLRRALIAIHTLVAGDGVEFVSLIDPPADLGEHARACRSEFTFPVLGGEPPTGHVLLSSPIVLPDHPQVAPGSPGDLHDAAEIDEIPTLRTMLLTDQEKHEAHAGRPPRRPVRRRGGSARRARREGCPAAGR
ncbi:hypothetical protein SGRIM128S_06736 [Streptomyces griseomycini]|nr:hypothetical protein GCM10015536_10420 [Streptomyces griseomycini]